MPDVVSERTDRVVTEDRFGRQWLWEPTAYLRFRKRERGMVLEQKFVGTSFGEPTRSEWRPVEVVPESMNV